MLETAIAAAILLTATFAFLRFQRARLYRELGTRQRSLPPVSSSFSGIGATGHTLPSFTERIAVLDDVLPPALLAKLGSEIEALGKAERSYLPTHKKGGTVAYETLTLEAPDVVAFYQSRDLHDLIGGIVGERIVPTPLHDQSSCSVLFYEKPGDHIGWHYDHNFYKGRHFTVLIPIVNRDKDGTALSAARLMAKVGKEERVVPTPPNRMVVFEGARIIHKATPIAEGERRVVLSMTFCTDPRNSVLQGIARRIKDTAFFGIRALWT